jgi:hypothetical protein
MAERKASAYRAQVNADGNHGGGGGGGGGGGANEPASLLHTAREKERKRESVLR